MYNLCMAALCFERDRVRVTRVSLHFAGNTGETLNEINDKIKLKKKKKLYTRLIHDDSVSRNFYKLI